MEKRFICYVCKPEGLFYANRGSLFKHISQAHKCFRMCEQCLNFPKEPLDEHQKCCDFIWFCFLCKEHFRSLQTLENDNQNKKTSRY